ncbi:MAG: GNAT family N-acetyltransferase [Anaerolineales bacterium]|nr:GNAT family N-acetyltransferase [Anaerolineales bacterium]
MVDDFSRRAEILPRSQEEIAENICDWFVADVDGELVACGSLLRYSESLSEVRSLVVAPDYQGTGIGSKLMRELIDLARERRIRSLFALTRSVEFFTKMGFRPSRRESFPEKVMRDCLPCPILEQCDEQVMLLSFD